MNLEPIETKQDIKRRYLQGEISLSDAVRALVFGHDMTYNDAYAYLEL